MVKSVRFNLDALGMCASTLCMIHCLVFPLLLAALPILQLSADDGHPVAASTATDASALTLAGSEPAASCAACCATPADYWVHVGLLATVAPLGIVAWGMGYRHHRRTGVLCLGVFGVLLLSSALLFGHHLLGGRGEQVMTVAGSLCIVSAHLWNRRQCRCCRTPDLSRLVAVEAAPTELHKNSLSNGGVS